MFLFLFLEGQDESDVWVGVVGEGSRVRVPSCVRLQRTGGGGGTRRVSEGSPPDSQHCLHPRAFQPLFLDFPVSDVGEETALVAETNQLCPRQPSDEKPREGHPCFPSS